MNVTNIEIIFESGYSTIQSTPIGPGGGVCIKCGPSNGTSQSMIGPDYGLSKALPSK